MGYEESAAYAATAGMSVFGMILYVAFIALMLVAYWKIFVKAGEPGWAVIVPFYNVYVMYKIAFGNGWMFLLMFIPFVNLVVAIIALFKFSKAFGHGVGFGFGLLFLAPIFLLILAFGPSEYVGA